MLHGFQEDLFKRAALWPQVTNLLLVLGRGLPQDLLRLPFRDLAHNKGMSLLFSSHLLPDVEAVCEHVIVLGAGKLLAEGKIQQLKQIHNRCFEVRLKAPSPPFTQRLAELGCTTEARDDLLFVQIPEGQSQQVLWQTAAEHQQQIRYLRPQRSTLEEIFLKAVEHS